MTGRSWPIAFVLAACTVDGGRGESATFGSATVSTASATTALEGTSDGSSASATATTSTGDGGDLSTTGGPTSTSGAIDPDSGSSSDGGSGGCPPQGPLDCSQGPGSGEPDTCDLDGVSCFLPTVKTGVMGVVDGHPEWIDDTSGMPFVLEPESYMNAVVDAVSGAGLCAIRDPNAGDEIAVKHDNGYAESFDILSAEGYARWGDGIYTATCAPSWF